jgi:type VI protein secretion system component Hcp
MKLVLAQQQNVEYASSHLFLHMILGQNERLVTAHLKNILKNNKNVRNPYLKITFHHLYIAQIQFQ